MPTQSSFMHTSIATSQMLISKAMIKRANRDISHITRVAPVDLLALKLVNTTAPRETTSRNA